MTDVVFSHLESAKSPEEQQFILLVEGGCLGILVDICISTVAQKVFSLLRG